MGVHLTLTFLDPCPPLKIPYAHPRAQWVNPFCSDCRDPGPEGKRSRTGILWEAGKIRAPRSSVEAGRLPLGNSVFLWKEARIRREAAGEWGRGVPSETSPIFTVYLCPYEPQGRNLVSRSSFALLPWKTQCLGCLDQKAKRDFCTGWGRLVLLYSPDLKEPSLNLSPRPESCEGTRNPSSNEVWICENLRRT